MNLVKQSYARVMVKKTVVLTLYQLKKKMISYTSTKFINTI